MCGGKKKEKKKIYKQELYSETKFSITANVPQLYLVADFENENFKLR